MSARQQRVIGVPLGVHNVTTSNPDENTQYRVGQVDPLILLDEIFNSSTRAVCVYGKVGNIMLEDGTYVEGPDDMIEDCLDDDFGDDDMFAVSSVLPYNTSLLAVNVNGVAVTDSSIVQMCRSLKNTKVRLVDLTNSVIDDETGVALLELAQENIHLRTIVVDDTLIADTLMDEIDMACLNNEAMVPNLPDPAPIDPNRPRYCVRNFFGVCSEGDDYCAWFHGAPPLPNRRDEDKDLKEANEQKRSLESVVALAAKSQKEAGLLVTKKSGGAAAAGSGSSTTNGEKKNWKQLRAEKEEAEKLEQQLKKQQEEAEEREKERKADEEKKEKKRRKKELERQEQLQKMMIRGGVVMAVSGVLAWFALKNIGGSSR